MEHVKCKYIFEQINLAKKAPCPAQVLHRTKFHPLKIDYNVKLNNAMSIDVNLYTMISS